MTKTRGGPIVRDRNTALAVGLAAYVLGTVMLWDAYENRGRNRPFGFRFLSGWV